MKNGPILLIEDNPDDQKLTLRALQKNNITNEVVIAEDGAQAFEYLFGTGRFSSGTGDRLPALVLLDLKLPKIDGLSVLTRLRTERRTRTVPVVILTSSREEEDIARSYELGANSYVRKPVDFLEFVDTARQLGAYWLILNEPPVQGEP